MIEINLLGGIKKLVGHSNLKINEESSSVKGIISYLENNYYSNIQITYIHNLNILKRNGVR